jgi:uncharacterized protein (TIGR02266 family)
MAEPSSPEGIPITLRIKFKSASLDDFVARYGADVSAGGIFIRTKQPLAVGSSLHFDFSLADGSPLMAGLGTVVWVREPEPSRVGSIPGMGVRFDQLAPESQQTHQQILAVKARRGDRPTATPPQSPAAAAPPRPAARPATPPPLVARPTPAKPVAAQPSSRGPSDTFDEFASGGKTEIADRAPSFYFDSLDKAHGAAAGEPPAEDAAPKATLDDTNTDSQLASPADPSWSEPIDISEDASATVPSAAAIAARAAATEQGRPQSAGDELRPASLDLPLGDSAQVADLPPPSEPVASPAAGQSWLDRAMKMTDGASAAPVETSAEHTEETAAPPEAMLAQAPAPAVGDAGRPVFGDAQGFGEDVPDLLAKKSGGQGKKLIVVGIVAAGLAFAGVYLMQTKPWQTPVAPASRPAPAEPVPSPVAAPAVPKVGQPSQPAAAPTPPPAEAVPVKPAAKLPTPEPTAAPAKTKPEVVVAAKPVEAAKLVQGAKPVEAAKPVETAEAAKHPGAAAGSAKKTPSKPASSPALSAPAPAGPSEIVYLVKVRSLPPGAQVLIDGEPMGQTPFQRRILDIDKPHTVTIRRPGYLSYESSVSRSSSWVKDGNLQTLGVFAKLKKVKGQAAESSAAPPEAPPAPANDQPEKL